ncbi:MAG: hypothetical protein GWN01_09165 [Nitrosopumilaceae archaeon]|nr:hypothetical protein [Nitrosopumilaceae archaeon]NIU87779.1 hypothetical protein [Nitrosopumilaceae archaeon]NIV65162.1 hypothetical protein [Nitrosopumilaceae archaeon]NIX61677.1 hypothetical protein [Nitrosopumilaceae archaeon]
MSITIAKLDEKNRLVGIEQVEEPSPNDIVVDSNIDLPLDGSYKYEKEMNAFFPLGYGFGPLSSKSPISNQYALYLIIKNLNNPPEELKLWASWYELNYKRQDEEHRARKTILERAR